MKKLSIVLITLTTIMFVSCLRVQPSEDNRCEYLPLKVGNEWAYRDGLLSDYTNKVVRTKRILAENWYEIALDKEGYTHGNYWRVDSNKVYKIFNDEQFLLIDFDRDVGVEREVVPLASRRHTILSKDYQYIMDSDTIFNCIQIMSVSDIDSSFTVYAPGIGMVYSKSWSSYNSPIRLMSAVIDGVTIEF